MGILRWVLLVVHTLAVAGVLITAVAAARAPHRPPSPGMLHSGVALAASAVLLLLVGARRTPWPETIADACAVVVIVALVVANRGSRRAPAGVAPALSGLVLFHATLALAA